MTNDNTTMFTGIVEKSVEVTATTDRKGGLRLTLGVRWDDLRPGESVAVNGACLSAVEIDDNTTSFDAIRETLDKTNLGRLRAGDRVHVERALRVGDRLDGHFVQGHVDATGKLLDRRSDDREMRLVVAMPNAVRPFMIPKGSVAIDGVSLTIAAVRDDAFEVALIPTTLDLTLLGQREIGWRFNLEADMISKTVVRRLEMMNAPE